MRRLSALLVLGVTVALVVAFVEGKPQRWFEKVRYPLRYESIVRAHARNYHLDPALLAAVIYQESKFRPTARSSSGAVGLMQLMPQTAEGIAARTGGTKFQLDDLLDPELNVRYGAWYLRYLLDRYGDERLALAAYNAGQRTVDEWRQEGSGIRFPETRAYVDRVEHLKTIYRRDYDL
jgi:soluble lytic murein transglycosylase